MEALPILTSEGHAREATSTLTAITGISQAHLGPHIVQGDLPQ